LTHTTYHTIPSTHPSLPGHFPGDPVVPGVVVLDEVLHALSDWQPGICIAGLRSVKFLKPVRPDCRFSIELELIDNWTAGFRCRLGDSSLTTGRIILVPGVTDS
jgi:3-hydroxyacyl-[acyl-carrier-protein] dehydratase